MFQTSGGIWARDERHPDLDPEGFPFTEIQDIHQVLGWWNAAPVGIAVPGATVAIPSADANSDVAQGSTSVNPDVLLIDEVLSTGDASFRDKARDRMLELMQKARAVVYVTHDLSSAKEFCTRSIELEGGKIIADGPARSIIDAYEKKMRGELRRRA
jgi:hypothetical protein